MSSSSPMSREYPATSAARIAASLLWTRCSATGLSQTRVGSESLCAGGARVHKARITASGHGRRYSKEAHFDRFGRIATKRLISRDSAVGYKRSASASRTTSVVRGIADTIGRKADVAWECAARAEIYAACAASSRSTCCTVAVDIPSLPAICRIDPPASLAWTTARRRAMDVGGRPMGFPDFVPCSLARASPAWMRSAMISRSNSANTPSIWNIALPAGVPVSRPCLWR